MKRSFGFDVVLEGMTVRMEGVVEDNWFAVRHADSGELVSVGLWSPPPGLGVVSEQVAVAQLPGLFVELLARAEA